MYPSRPSTSTSTSPSSSNLSTANPPPTHRKATVYPHPPLQNLAPLLSSALFSSALLHDDNHDHSQHRHPQRQSWLIPAYHLRAQKLSRPSTRRTASSPTTPEMSRETPSPCCTACRAHTTPRSGRRSQFPSSPSASGPSSWTAHACAIFPSSHTPRDIDGCRKTR